MDPALRDYWDKRQKARLKALMVSKKRLIPTAGEGFQ
jgi:hypothetical protein